MSDFKTQRDKYLSERVINQINWYERKSALNKKWFYVFRTTLLLASATIPFLASYVSDNLWSLKIVIGILSVIIVISEGILTLKKYQENWIIYRTTAEKLTREKLLFEFGISDDYSAQDEMAFRRFVVKSEKIMSDENVNWNSSTATTDQKGQKN